MPQSLGKGKAAAPQVDRQLHVKLTGVVPTDVELVTFLGRLAATKVFDHVKPTYAKDQASNGHVMREFEVTFDLNLNPPAEAKP